MADQESFVRVTRLTNKRAAEAMIQHLQQPNRKRVVLSEIQDLSNVGMPQSKQTIKRKAKRSVSEKDKEFDVDAKLDDDPQMCSAYASDIYIYDYLHHWSFSNQIEKKRRPLPDYLEKVQKDVSANCKHDQVLVDWLVEVAEEYKLLPDTLYLTVSHIGRFL